MDCLNDSERLIAEQAVLAYRAVQEAADQAAFGHGMEAMEEAALTKCREQVRRMLCEAARSRIESQKGGAVARGVAAGRGSSVGGSGR